MKSTLICFAIFIIVIGAISKSHKKELDMTKRFYCVPPFTYEIQIFEHSIVPSEVKMIAKDLINKYPQYDSVLVNKIDEYSCYNCNTYSVKGDCILIFYFYSPKKFPTTYQYIQLTNDVSHLGNWCD